VVVEVGKCSNVGLKKERKQKKIHIYGDGDDALLDDSSKAPSIDLSPKSGDEFCVGMASMSSRLSLVAQASLGLRWFGR
jgi:hypothetical protein